MNKRNEIVLSEEDLHFIVEESVKQYMINEGMWGGVQNVLAGFGNGNLNIRGTYKAGKYASTFNSAAQKASDAIDQMMTVAQQTRNQPISTALNKIKGQIGRAAKNFSAMAQNVAKPQNINMQVKNPWAAKAGTAASGKGSATGTPATP